MRVSLLSQKHLPRDTYLALQIIQHVTQTLYDILLDLYTSRQRSEDSLSRVRIIACRIVIRSKQCERDLPQNIDLLLLQLRESIKLMAEVAYTIEWLATRFACKDVGFLDED